MYQTWGHAFSLLTALQQALFVFQNKLPWWSQWRLNPSQIGNTESYLLNHAGCLGDSHSSIPKEDPWKPFKWCCHFPSKIIISIWRFFYVVGPNPCHNRLGVSPREEVDWEKQWSTTLDRNGDMYSWSWVSSSLLALGLPSQGRHASYLSPVPKLPLFTITSLIFPCLSFIPTYGFHLSFSYHPSPPLSPHPFDTGDAIALRH